MHWDNTFSHGLRICEVKRESGKSSYKDILQAFVCGNIQKICLSRKQARIHRVLTAVAIAL